MGPFRRAEGTKPPSPPAAVKEKKSTKSKNKSFLDSSDDEALKAGGNSDDEPKIEGDSSDEESKKPGSVEKAINEDNDINDENADPENKENVPQKKAKKTPIKNVVKTKKSTIDKARLLKLLNDDSDMGSSDSDDEGKKKKESDTSDEGVVDPLPGENKKEKLKKARAPRKKQQLKSKAQKSAK